MTTTFHSTTSAAGGGFDYWRSLMRRHFALSSGRPGTEGRFDAQLSVSPLGAVTVFGMVAPLQRWTRAQRHLRSDPHDEFVLTLMLSGSGCLEQDGNQAVQGAGVISVFDTGKPYDYVQCGETLCVEIPRRELLARLGCPVPLAVPFSTDRPLGRLLLEVIRTASRGEAPDAPSSEARIGASLIELTAALFEAGPGQLLSPATVPAALPIERVRRHVRAHLGDPALSLASIARATALSPRTITRLFAAEGGTPMRWVWQERLAASYRALCEPGGARVTEVAFANGFSGLSHFSRAFKARYGFAPRDIQAVAPR
jgi:AraC-like DNA-binding protein